jgi:hypothetical protein
MFVEKGSNESRSINGCAAMAEEKRRVWHHQPVG